MNRNEPSLAVRIATLGPLGWSPLAPGTVGTVVAGVPAAYLLSFFSGWIGILILLAVFVLACHVSGRAARELATPDPSQVVIDELTGLLVTMAGLPFTMESLLLGVAAFRLFDIWKPWPVNVLDRKVKGGIGIVLDDVAAGALAHVLVWIVLKVYR